MSAVFSILLTCCNCLLIFGSSVVTDSGILPHGQVSGNKDSLISPVSACIHPVSFSCHILLASLSELC